MNVIKLPLWARNAICTVVVAVVTVPLAGQVPATAAPEWTAPKAPQVKGYAVRPVHPADRPSWTADDHVVRGEPKIAWPKSAQATVEPGPAAAAAQHGRATEEHSGLVRAGDLPVSVAVPAGRPGTADASAAHQAPGRVAVQVYDRAAAQAADLDGMLLSVARTEAAQESDGGQAAAQAGSLQVEVDYSSIADAYGGDWASRLRLMQVPACALTTPDAPGCTQATPLKTANHIQQGRLTATVPLAADQTPTVLAAAAGPAGDNGDYRATSLSPAGTWQVSQQTGDFSWNYPIEVPQAPGGLEPELALSYSSGSVDGRSAAANTQGSWVGDGWGLWPGYIERQYRGCGDDKDAVGGQDPNNKSVYGGDQCWFDDNATLSLNGQATELVKGSDGTWHGASDEGWRVERLTGASNGDDDGEHWKVTTPDGTQYFFGKQTASEAVWTGPVYGNHAGEPCHASAFADSDCSQAWRWNVDHVVDPHGNTMEYFYGKETGAYGREGDVAKRTTYTRGGWLSRIDYGTRVGSTAPAAGRVVFDVADRCAPGATCDADHPASWPDTPWDQYCKASPCTDKVSVTFWTQKRLSRIRTQVYNGSGYSDVDWYTLRQEYLDAGTGEGKPMWLRGLTHTGKVTSAGGGEVSEPEVVFDPGQDALANRVDGPADGRSELARWRIDTITTESGAQISPEYSGDECTRTGLPAPHANTKRCFPQYYAPDGEDPTLDWFHKRVVTRVDVYDNTGGFEHEQTNYDYLDAPAWHYDDSQLVPAKKRTWGQFRGYSKVRVRQGLESGTQSVTEYLYLRGMNGDKQPSGVRNVVVTDSQDGTIEDHESYNGFLREEITYNGVNGAVVSGKIHTPWRRGPIATYGPLTSWMTRTATTRTRTPLSSGRVRWTRTDTSYNTEGLPTQVDELGDEATAADDTCERTEYARNATAWILDAVKRVETVGVRCSATPARPGDVLSDQRIHYDDLNAAWGTPPTRGNPVKTEELASWNGSTPGYVTTERTVYDAAGRVIESYDALNRKTTTAYTPALAGPVTQVVTTNPAGHKTTVTNAPAWQLPVKTVDANDAVSEMVYDGLGRLLKVWTPDRPRTTKTPGLQFSYAIRSTAPSAVTSQMMLPNGDAYKTSITLYDGLLRERQIQVQAPGGGRVVSDTVHDSRGLVEWTSTPYYDMSNAPPSTTLVTSVGTPEIPAMTRHVHDGAGREVAEIFLINGNERWRTTTAYGGDRVTVTPPAGGTATMTISDALGRTMERRQYHALGSAGSDDPATYDKTSYSYTERNELYNVTDAAGNVWRYHYDQRGRKWKEEDPDHGVTTMTYDDADQMLTSTDARNVTLGYTYDALGRKTSIRDGSVTGPKRAEWTFDTAPHGIGRPAKSIRYDGTSQYIDEVTGYDIAGRETTGKVTIPVAETGLAGTYSYATTYKASGQVESTTLPAAGGLGAETVAYTYDDVGNQTGILSGQQIYVRAATYDKLGNLAMRELGQHGKRVYQVRVTDERTGRLMIANSVPEEQPEVYNYDYSYDDAGNLTKIADTPNTGQPADTQCFVYDYLRRLTRAWTPSTGSCTTAPTTAGLGGPAPYWRDFTYDVTGNRRSEVIHASAGDTKATYTYPDAGGARPHGLSQVQTTGPAGTRTDTFDHDAAGNTKSRNGTTLTWDNEGELKTSGGDSYLYDADGNRLIRRTAQGKTLYLGDDTEVFTPAAGGTATATRYYNHAGDTIAVRTSSSLTWIISDHHSTGEAAVSSTNLSVTRRRTLPFGELRGTPPTAWAGNRGFVNGTLDPGGLVHLGARAYDPALGRFLSVDPLVDTAEPQTLNAYAYGNNAAPTYSDPDGLMMAHDGDAAGGGGRRSSPPARHPVAKCRGDICYYHGSTPGAWDSMKKKTRPVSKRAPEKKAEVKRPWWKKAWDHTAKGVKTASDWMYRHREEILDGAILIGSIASLAFPGLGVAVLGLSLISVGFNAAQGDIPGTLLSLPGIGVAGKAMKVGRSAYKSGYKLATLEDVMSRSTKKTSGHLARKLTARGIRRQLPRDLAADRKWTKIDRASSAVGTAVLGVDTALSAEFGGGKAFGGRSRHVWTREPWM
ncbi:hypothetical protein ETD86_02510 [Nonomuraea turkmeniaca]|uniref:Teneurin-like YD-shell domain-containing protein n=1 Tax=Nonomuraea turkmeniaca TaxID=103838 RepID=A0A5S4FWH9_9ACTN|nr:RHS repeat-associated core domain-containing protein [Nonomuraea turkmeniaca]TMR25008.1 hypothetical protein ETD86_02510 [Nonomuraea turkmeniaca]